MKKLLLTLNLLLGASIASATSVLSDGFDSYATGVLPTGTGTNWVSSTDDNTRLFSRVQTDTADLFGAGIANQVLYFETNAAGSTVQIASTKTATIGTTGQISFSFYEPTYSGAAGSGYILRIGAGGAGNGNTAFGIALQRGALRYTVATSIGFNSSSTVGSYSLDTLNTVTVVFNNSNSATTYDTSRTLSAQTFDLWLNGSIVASGLPRSGSLAANTAIDNINFTSKDTQVGALYLDDLSLDNTISITSSIPEPSSAALLTGSAIGLLVLTGRKSRSSSK